MKNPWLLLDMLGVLGVKAYRRKVKQRISLQLGMTKYDIDDYGGKINTLLEIETDTGEKAEGIIEILQLQDHKRLLTGSRGLFEHYGEKYEYIDDNHGILVPDWVKESIKKSKKAS